MYFVYILESLKTGHHYIGFSTSPNKRLEEHNSGSTRSTKPYRPWKIIYIEPYSTKSLAAKREWYLKHPIGFLEKKKIIVQYGSNGSVA